MPKSKQTRFEEYTANKNHVVGSEAWLSDDELESKRRIEELNDPNHPSNSPENKKARERRLDELMGKIVIKYGDMKG